MGYGMAQTVLERYSHPRQLFNLASLPSTLSRLLPDGGVEMPGVNSPYLYFGTPKFWYAMPQGRANTFENVMRSESMPFASLRDWLTEL